MAERYAVHNHTKKTEALANSIEEAKTKVNEIVGDGDEWVIVKLPERVGAGAPVREGTGRIVER